MTNVAVSSNKQSKPKYTKRTLIILLAALLVIVITPTTTLAYMGFVPVATELTGTNRPVDLGIQYSTADFKSAQKKTMIAVSNFDNSEGISQGIGVAPGIHLVISGANSIQVTLTQEELTAFINLLPWTVSPLMNAQVRLNNDGTVEFSGNVDSNYVSDLIKMVYPSGDYEQLNPILKLADYLHNPAVYVKASISSINMEDGPAHGQLTLKVLALKVNRMDLTEDVSTMNEITTTVAEGNNEQGIAYSLSSLSVSDKQVQFYGTIPANFNVGGSDPSVICENLHEGSLISLNAVDGRIGSVLKYCD